MSDTEDESSSAESNEWPVTEQWLEAILKRYHATADGGSAADDADEPCVSVAEFSVRPGCDAGESVLSDILAVNVEYRLAHGIADSRFLSFIVKLLPQDPFSRFFVTEAQFDLREIKFYTQVVPDLEKFQREALGAGEESITLPIPRCYHAHYSAGGGGEQHKGEQHKGEQHGGGGGHESPRPPESVLVLENMRPRGYCSADFSRGLTLRQARAAVEAVARVHALSLCLKLRSGRPLPERYPFLFQTSRATDSYQQLVERGLPQLAAFLERRPGLEAVVRALHALRASTKRLIAALLAPREPLALITHTDFWCNNLMFRDGDDGAPECECAILDWQMVTYSRPTNDLALLLVSSLPSELRRRHTDALLDHYWAALVGCCRRLGVDVEREHGYGRAQLAADYRRSQLLALLLCIGSVDVALGDPLTEQRLLDVLHDLHADGVLSTEAADAAAADAAAEADATAV